jgi:hypothetical protein
MVLAPARASLLAVGAVVLAAAMVVAPRPVHASTPAPPVERVALIGDSTLLGLTYNPSAGRDTDARSIISARYQLFYGAKSCQRLVAPSCGSNPPPTALETMQANAGQLGQVLVIMGGYDDAEIVTGVDAIVAEAARQGIGTVMWLTYRTGDLSYQYAYNYVGFNAVLRQKASAYGSMVLADWDAYSHDHPEWMTADGVHVNATGAMALAQFIVDQIAAATPSRCGGAEDGDASTAPGSSSTATPGATAALARFTPVVPRRVLDTRPGDGDAFSDPLGAGHTMRVPLHATGSIAAAVNLTAAGPCGAGYLTAYPCDATPPLVSNVNQPAWRTTATASTVMLDASGDFCVYAYATTDLVVDLFGLYGPAGAAFSPLTPTRVVDTRPGAASALHGELVPNTPVAVKMAGVNGVPLTATAVSFNLTAIDPGADVYVSAFPCGPPPLVSNVNTPAGSIVANGVVVALDASGSVCLVANAPVDIALDVTGSFGPTGARYLAQTPTRLADTRDTGRLAAGRSLVVTVPGGGTAAAVSVTAVNPSDAGYLTVAPCGTAPLASAVNYVTGDLVTNFASTGLDRTGRLCVTTSDASDVVVDLVGVWR